MPDARGRGYTVNPGGGPEELAREPDNEVPSEESPVRGYVSPVEPPQDTPSVVASTPAPAMEVVEEDVEDVEDSEDSEDDE